jgi:hypothetical protein
LTTVLATDPIGAVLALAGRVRPLWLGERCRALLSLLKHHEIELMALQEALVEGENSAAAPLDRGEPPVPVTVSRYPRRDSVAKRTHPHPGL